MESPFDRLDKDWENKSNQKKPKGKKQWILSRQYLQPLEEPHDVVENELVSDLSVRNKLKCICRSAFYGMKEGLLTGVFLGGFYGVLKLLNGSSSIFFGSTESTENNYEKEKMPRQYYGGGVLQERKNSGRNRRTDTRAYLLSGRRQSGSRSSSISYQGKLLSYRTMEETLYGLSKEKKPQNSYAPKRARNIGLSYSKLPIKIDKHLGSLSSKVSGKKKYDGSVREKIEIVGYALVQTKAAFETESTTSKSVAYFSPKQSKSELEKKDKEEEEEEEEQDPQKSKASVENSATVVSSLRSESLKSPEKRTLAVRDISSKSLKSKENGLTGKREKSIKSLKSKESVIPKHERSSRSLKVGESLLTAKQEKYISSVRSGSTNTIDESVTPTTTGNEKEHRESLTKGLHKAFSSLKGVTSKNRSKQSIISEVDEDKHKPSRITIVSPKRTSRDSSQIQNAEQSSSVFIKSLEPEQSEISTRPTIEITQASRSRSKESYKTSPTVGRPSLRSSVIVESEASISGSYRRSSRNVLKGSEFSKRRVSENLYPSGHLPPYLVNAEDVSNGYSSPVTVTDQESEHSEHDAIQSKYSEYDFTPEMHTSTAEFDDVGVTGSNISEFQIKFPPRAFSPSVSATQTGQSETLKSSAWNFRTFQDSSTKQPEESESAVSKLKDESYFPLKTDTQTESFIFSDSGKSEPQKDRPSLVGGPSSQQSEKLLLSSEQISEKSQVADSFKKSLLSGEHGFESSQAACEYTSERSLLSGECLNDRTPSNRSSTDDQYFERFDFRTQESPKKSCTPGLAKSNSSLIQDVSPETSRCSVAIGASVASQTQKASPEKKGLTEFGVFSSVTDNTIVLCACNCAIILGILCTVISTTRASLKI